MPVDEPHRVVCHLDRVLEQRRMTLAALAAAVGVSVVNLSTLKNNRARAVRFSTITAICDVLGCELGDVLAVADRDGEPRIGAHQNGSGGVSRRARR
ncbi:MAG: helix-turn-helix domain-containing protein [Dermatophilaceae bacterium]